MEKLTFGEAIFCDLFWLFLFFIFLPSLKDTRQKISLFLVWLLISIYSTFEFTGGDFYNYLALYNQNLSSSDPIHLEYFYYWLIQILPSSYFLWRFFLWSIATFFWILILDGLKQNIRFSGLIFILVVFYLFVGARQALCFSVLYYALFVFCGRNEQLSLKNVVFSFFLIVLSFFLHKMAVVSVLIMLFSLLPIGKKSFILSLFAFPFLYKIFDSLAYSFILEYSAFNAEGAKSMDMYMEGENIQANFNGLLRIFIDRIPIFILLFYSMWRIFLNKEYVPRIYRILLRMSYLMIYISYLFVGRDISKFIAPRFWDAALFPFTLFIAGYMYNKRKSKIFRICFCMLLISNFFALFYTLYKV